MPRPRKLRVVQELSRVDFFKPKGVPMQELETVVLSEDALEALRLVDAEGLEHIAAAEMMGISRPTLSRLVAQARTTVATALSEGLAIKIGGGEVRCCKGEELEARPWVRRRRRRGFCGRAGVTFEEAELSAGE
ncbi:DUF134 domain-containing protein [Rhodobacteraceae bacterium RKSG542]|uniref:DUF134 domain-containing protein n=1 Tax=Pseudovibrio flavus TaxID=2529854 RepID=UPI0012BC90E2|nr:DUF134 domain-containing protein [Pseudovibrio flavus]MTI18011.1 DUF134 domain-containing protein [Pseudovibrio flavus]